MAVHLRECKGWAPVSDSVDVEDLVHLLVVLRYDNGMLGLE
jgi:hypothetical protein